MELKEKNNVWLWLYRYYVGDFEALPDSICPLFWKGLLSLILIPLSLPMILILLLSRGGGFDRKIYNNNHNAWTMFGLSFLIGVVYIMGLDLATEMFELSWWVIVFGWVIPLIGMCIVGGLFVGAIYFFAESKSNIIEVPKEAIKAKFNKICPRITWKKQ